eukprot:NODE_6_length_48303_cov_0.387022.p17 type:complete len:213 gc:universal NODE_6_length_48303_cov_0.387022:47217-46579(-)
MKNEDNDKTDNILPSLTGFKFKPKFKPRNTDNSELTSIQKQQRLNRKEEFENRLRKIEDRKYKKQVHTQNQMIVDEPQQDFQMDTRVEDKIDLHEYKFDKQLLVSDIPLKDLLKKACLNEMPPSEAQEFYNQIHMLCMPPLPKVSGNGLIGKVRVYKSGKCELVLGSMVFELGMGIQSKMLQKVILTQVYGDSKISDFGSVRGKIVASIHID